MNAPRTEDSIAVIASAHAVEMVRALGRLTHGFRTAQAWSLDAELDELANRLGALVALRDSLSRVVPGAGPDYPCRQCGLVEGCVCGPDYHDDAAYEPREWRP